MDRVTALTAMLEADPGNHFARYGLAQEWIKRGDDEQALREFRRILAEDPEYQAAYYHGGKALERLGKRDEALDLYKLGVEASYRTGNAHARSELEAAIDEVSA